MKAVILAGGLGTRISEETEMKPKPMIEIGTMPVLWHIMKIYSYFGVNDFIVCLGYKGYYIKEYFANYFMHMSDVTFDMCNNKMEVHRNECEPWRVTLIDTGVETATGGRLRRVRSYIGDETFCFTYGDGVTDLNISDLIRFHESHGRLATVTAVQPAARYGGMDIDGRTVRRFEEKPKDEGGWVSGGFFVLSPKVIDRIDGDETAWEGKPLQGLASQGELIAYQHKGFWLAMDTLRDKKQLETLWGSGKAPWKRWE